ncbi:mechanosensitive ion channel-like protein [Hydrogenivirga caldilitoris]|uniref:Mechanosensitive ion channel-like protein n=1 Tax=Hydrogenivirga caldilitoris TaxID=246264 RepID=A0A497XPG1_9AQUI|nr:mechanosensitive ion channel domain-containing protein [Hydrogenivirga caldilitoris]RLJ70847.1 mechanosensitive ion channel-like protein [Hydrogenivirga caldilitoris]
MIQETVNNIYKILSDTLALLASYLTDIAQNPLQELVLFLAFSGAYLFLKLLTVNFTRPLREKGLNVPADIFSLLILYGASFLLYQKFSDVDLFLFLFAFLYFEVVRGLFSYLRAHLPFGRISVLLFYALLVVNSLLLFLQNISYHLGKLQDLYSLGFKVSFASLVSLFVIKVYSHLAVIIGSEVLRRTLRRGKLAFLVLYLALSIGWVLGTFRLSQSFLLKLFLLAGVLFGYFFIQAYLLINLERKLGTNFQLLRKDLRRFLNTFSLFILYKGLDVIFGLDPVRGVLGKLFIVNTELVKISLLSLLESTYILVLLFTSVSLLKNLVYLYFIRKDKEVEAGSLRALISNLGILLSVVIALTHLGLTWKVLIPFAGALGIGLGFGLQTIFNNYISGFILLLSKNIKVGDLVEIEGNAGSAIGRSGSTIFGQVVNINILTTVVRTTDNVEIAIPNSEFVSGRIVNYSLSDPYIRVRIPFGVSYSSDPQKVREVLLKVAQESELVLKEPPPNVWFYEMGDSALIFYLLVWVDIRKFWRMKALRSEIYFKAWEELKKEGIEVPFPQRDLWFKNPLRVEINERGLHEGSSQGG